MKSGASCQWADKIELHYFLFAMKMKIIYICSNIYKTAVMNYNGG